jgi:hypothetical protein
LDDVEATGAESGHVLHEHEAWSKHAKGIGNGFPEAAPATGDAGTFASVGDVLAGEAGGDDVDRLDPLPVDLTEVTDVGNSGVSGFEHPARCSVDFGVPGEFGANNLFDGEVEPAKAGAH